MKRTFKKTSMYLDTEVLDLLKQVQEKLNQEQSVDPYRGWQEITLSSITNRILLNALREMIK